MPHNRFVARANGTRAQTWHIKDHATGAVVMDQLTPDMAKEWTKGMNEDQRAGRPVVVMGNPLPAIPHAYGAN